MTNKEIRNMAQIILNEYEGMVSESDAFAIAKLLVRKGYHRSEDTIDQPIYKVGDKVLVTKERFKGTIIFVFYVSSPEDRYIVEIEGKPYFCGEEDIIDYE